MTEGLMVRETREPDEHVGVADGEDREVVGLVQCREARKRRDPESDDLNADVLFGRR